MNDWPEYGQQDIRDHFAVAVESMCDELKDVTVYTRLIQKHIDAWRELSACHEPIPNLFELDSIMAWAECKVTKAAETLRDVDLVLDTLRRR